MKYIDFRPPKLCKGNRWYIFYYYRIPKELQPIYGDKVWHRFRVNEDVNKYKDEKHAAIVLEAVLEALKSGYNPFEDEIIENVLDDVPKNKAVTIKKGIELFLSSRSERGLAKETVERYEGVCKSFNTWLCQKNIQNQPLERIKQVHIKDFLKEYKSVNSTGNRQRNNIKSYIYTLFEFLRKEHYILINPAADIESFKVDTKKHKYYDKTLFPKVTSIIKENEPYLWYVVQFVYYLAVRDSKELLALKVGDILDDGDTFFFRKEITKSGRDEYIPVDPHLKNVFKEMGLLKANPNHYIFTIKQQPGAVPASDNYFARRFRKIRKLAGLSQDYTIYGFKHTRAIHLVKDGANIADIMKLFRHADLSATSKYLRDLGVDFDAKDLHSKSRKI